MNRSTIEVYHVHPTKGLTGCLSLGIRINDVGSHGWSFRASGEIIMVIGSSLGLPAGEKDDWIFEAAWPSIVSDTYPPVEPCKYLYHYDSIDSDFLAKLQGAYGDRLPVILREIEVVAIDKLQCPECSDIVRWAEFQCDEAHSLPYGTPHLPFWIDGVGRPK